MLEESPVIRKIAPPHPGMDFWALRKEGLERIIELGSGIWTDFNVHDPGITILEVLCYAITDLSYRCNLPVQDLLADQTGRVPPPGMPAPPQVLSCYPVTTYDLRKVLIDLKGVKNAWIYKARPEVAFGITGPIGQKKINLNSSNKLRLNGLYKVLIDLDDDVMCESCNANETLQRVERTLHHYRNLCEDIVGVDIVQEQPVQLCASIALEEDAIAEQVMAELAYTVQEFLTPTVQFYGLEQMLQRRGTRSLETVFEGPLLENGFIDESELADAELRQRIYVSDLYNLMRKVPGVKDVYGAKVKTPGTEHSTWQEWQSDELPPQHKPILDLAGSQFRLFKFDALQLFDANEVQEQWEQLRWERKPGSARDRMAVTYPLGTHRSDLGDYFTVQNDFPQTFHVGTEGLEESAPRLRHAQMKQLKAFLTFFDQILANYLVHLAQVKNLLSTEQGKGDGPTLFGDNLSDAIPFVDQLLEQPGYNTFVTEGLETTDARLRQRSAILSHLLARFGETFADYALITWYDDPDTTGTTKDFLVQQERNIAEKSELLRSAPTLGAQRGKGFDYRKRLPERYSDIDQTSPDVWNTNNVEGLKKRVCALLGIPDPSRKTLTCPPSYTIRYFTEGGTSIGKKGKTKKEEKPKTYLFDLKNAQGINLLDAFPGMPTDSAIKSVARELLQVLVNPANYEILDRIKDKPIPNENLEDVIDEANEALETTNFTLQKEPGQNGYRLYVSSDEKKFLARSAEGIKLETELDLIQLIKMLKAAAFNEDCAADGFHIVEHILLRPRFAHCADGDDAIEFGKCAPGFPAIADPYSFWITVVAPMNWRRFLEPANRQFFERTLREETPAHIGVRICWLDNDTMYRFEKAYGSWLIELSEPKPDSCDLDKATEALVAILNGFKDCSCCGKPPESQDLLCQ
jgi:uncharacterized protein